MLQITKASEVVPMSLYLWGIFFHGGQTKSKPASLDPLSQPKPTFLSSSSTSTPLTNPPLPAQTFSLSSLIFSFSLILHKNFNFNRYFEELNCKWRFFREVLFKTIELCEVLVLWKRKQKLLSNLRLNFAISGFCCLGMFEKKRRETEFKDSWWKLNVWWLGGKRRESFQENLVT